MHLALDGSGPLYQQIYRALRAAILARKLQSGARLPSTRALAAELAVSRNVVLLAYELLLGEGYVAARAGSGTIVATSLPETTQELPSLAGTHGLGARRREAQPPRLSQTARRSMDLARALPPRWEVGASHFAYDFRFGRPAFGDFPHSVWCRLLGRRARRASRRDLDYGPPEGRIELREALAERLRRHRGVDASARNIVIVNGSQQALDLVARTLVDPGDRVLVEEPGYPGARWVLEAAGAVLVPAPVDDAGIRVAETRGASAPRLAYVTPSHQFPTGVVMSLARRLELLEWAARGDTIVVEDDYDGEYRYGGRPLQALAGIDTGERVVYVGTFSKPMFPALRLGYLVVPERLREPIVAAKAFADTGSAALEQLALADFISEGHFDRHVSRTRTRNAARRSALVAAVEEHFGDRAEIAGAPAGLHVLVWIRGRSGRPVASATRKAAAADVGIYSVAPYYLRPPSRTGVLLGYAPLSEKQIRDGIARLAEALA